MRMIRMVVLTAMLLVLKTRISASQIVSPLPWQVYDSWYIPIIDVVIEPPSDIHTVRIFRSWPGGENEILHQSLYDQSGNNFVEINIANFPSGQYRIEVDTKDEHLSSGSFMVITDVPQIRVTRPNHQSIAAQGDRVQIRWDVLERVPWYTTDFMICVYSPQDTLLACDSIVQRLNSREATWEILPNTAPGYYAVIVSTVNNPGNFGKGWVLIDAWDTPEFKIRLRRYNENTHVIDLISRNESAFRFLDLECSANLKNWRTVGVVYPGSWFIPNDADTKFFRLRQH